MMPYSSGEMEDASSIVYDDWDVVEKQMGGAQGQGFTIGEMYDFAMENGLEGNVRWTTDLLANSGGNWRGVDEWKLVDTNNDNKGSGFYASVFETAPDKAIIAFRGTEGSANDWINGDLRLLNSIETPQQHQGEVYLKELVAKGLAEKYGYLATAGHSLGGNLATDFTLEASTKGLRIDQCTVFDSPGFSDEYLKAHFLQILKSGNTITKYRWSAVGSLLFDIPGSTVLDTAVKGDGQFGAGPGGEQDDLPYGLRVHDPKATVRDSDNNVILANEKGSLGEYGFKGPNMGDQLQVWLMKTALGDISKLADLDPFMGVVTFWNTGLSYFNEFSAEIVGALKTVGQKGLALGSSFAQFAHDAFSISVAHGLAVSHALIDAGTSFTVFATNHIIAGLKAGIACSFRLFDAGVRTGFTISKHLSHMAVNTLAASIDAGVNAILMAHDTSVQAKSELRDFSNARRHELLSFIDGFLHSAPFNIAKGIFWGSIQATSERLVPCVMPLFWQINDCHNRINEYSLNARYEINRVFDQAQALDKGYAGLIRSDTQEIKRINMKLQTMANSLQHSVGHIQSLC